MKKSVYLFSLFVLIFSSCSKYDDGTNKSEQELILQGFREHYGNTETRSFSFLFFPGDDAEEYVTETFQIEGNMSLATYYEYEEDPIYKLLVEQQSIKKRDGSQIKALYSLNSGTGKPTETKLPVGKYFIVAFSTDKWDSHLKKKYAVKLHDLNSRLGEHIIICRINTDLSMYGCVPWK